MNEVITLGVDLAKNVFQVHGVDAAGETVIRRPQQCAPAAVFAFRPLEVRGLWQQLHH